ncbi:MAG: GWxTD domain-containing protein [marine benthic group bacterium]|nr:GWxTD domain-containing protein [Gemmatimonadota bacterium]
MLAEAAGRTAVAVALTALTVVSSGCGGGRPEVEGPSTARVQHVANVLDGYRDRGFLAGTIEFPVVGRIVLLAGPADSAWLGFAASMPPSALRFSKDGDLYAARYQVRLRAISGSDTVLSRERRETVRVDDFPETVSREERVFFQDFVTLPPGEYEVQVALRELTSRREAYRSFEVIWPLPADPGTFLSEPQPVFHAVPREAFAQPPPMLLAPRATVSAGREPLKLVVEDGSGEEGPLVVEVLAESDSGVALWRDTVQLRRTENGPATASGPLPQRRVPPGVTRLRVWRPESGIVRETALLVTLDDEWAFPDFRSAADHLRYAVSGDTLATWLAASPSERARHWEAFWIATDPDTTTLPNEFLRRYFDRMSVANNRYTEPGVPGWETDRGRAHVQLGPPDQEIARRPQRPGEFPEIEWRYEESLPFQVRLIFEDSGDFGVYNLDQRSRTALADAAKRLRAEETAG